MNKVQRSIVAVVAPMAVAFGCATAVGADPLDSAFSAAETAVSTTHDAGATGLETVRPSLEELAYAIDSLFPPRCVGCVGLGRELLAAVDRGEISYEAAFEFLDYYIGVLHS